MIKLISARKYPDSMLYVQTDLHDFWDWFQKVSEYELDFESNVVEDLLERELYVVQFGEVGGAVQYVIDYASLDDDCKKFIKTCLDDRSKKKIIHNAAFEYTLAWKEFGIYIDNIWDTMLGLKVIFTGAKVPEGFFKLSGSLECLYNIPMSKEEQTSFTGEQMTEAQILYAATDVMHMDKLRQYVMKHESYPVLENVVNLENATVRAFSDVMCHGFKFNPKKWYENYKWALGDADQALIDFHLLLKSDYKAICEELGFIQKHDECTINWNSPKNKAKFFGELYPDLVTYTKPAIKKFEEMIEGDSNLLYTYLHGTKEETTAKAMEEHYEVLERLGFVQKAGDILLNLNSSKQKLLLLQHTVDPAIKATSADDLKYYEKDPIVKLIKEYVGKRKICTSYGLKWLDHFETKISGKNEISEEPINETSIKVKGYISKDGRIRARYLDQILDTGRTAFSKPAIMTLPADEGYKYGNRFREPFVSEEGKSIVAVDWKSQEVVIANYLSGETTFIESIRDGADAHSVSAYKMYGKQWLDVGGDPEGWKKNEDDMDWKKMRSNSKTITFGNIYGMGPFTLSNRLDISEVEAEDLITKYFQGFPRLANWLGGRARFGMAHGYITTAPPFNRRRYFPEWNPFSIDPRDVGFIERRAKNTSVQGSAGDAAKWCMILIKHKIETEGWGDKVKIVMMLHDCIVCEVDDDFVDTWVPIQEEIMVEGHCINVPGRYIGADTTVTKTWIK